MSASIVLLLIYWIFKPVMKLPYYCLVLQYMGKIKDFDSSAEKLDD